MIGYSYRYSRLIITVQTVFHLFVLITRQSLPSSPIEIPGQTFYVLLAISNMSRISPLSVRILLNGFDEIFVRGEIRSSIHFHRGFAFFFFLPEKRTDSLSVFVYTMSDYSLILLNVQGLIYIFFISIRMEEEYNRNDLSYHRGGRKKKIIELKENVL